jgi:cytoskeletal protein CcmA (bactofilin family)
MRFMKQIEDPKPESPTPLSTLIKPASEPAPAPAPAPAAPLNGRAQDEGRAFLDRGSKVSGKISFDGAVRIDGAVDGEITGKDSITIAESATITAQIRAASVVVAGRVTGDIIATKRIEIRPSARVQGNLVSPALVVHEGAVFDGNCSMRSDGTREERKVAALPKEDRPVQPGAAPRQASVTPAGSVLT